MTAASSTATRPTLERRLTLRDAVFVGLGSMVGAGIFSAIAPAADAAGSWLLVSLAIAAVVAGCNALSSAQLAALYPAAGGTYVYGRERLSHLWGFLAGWGFVIGKTASCAAMALTFGYYVDEDLARLLAVVAVAVFTAINLAGVGKTAGVTAALAIVTIGSLSIPVVSALGIEDFDATLALPEGGPPAGLDLLQGAALLFFAFAGYARIATLGEEVVDPQRTIPRAIPIALAITLMIYALVIGAAMIALGADGLAASAAPLVAVVDVADLEELAPLVRVGAVVASLSVLLSLMAGVGRTTFAMAREHDLPSWLDAVHPRTRVPHRAEILIGGVVAVLAATLDLRDAIGFSSFAVLFYYAVANASAWTLSADQRRWPRWISVAGFAGCIALAVSLPWETLVPGGALFGIGLVVYAIRR